MCIPCFWDAFITLARKGTRSFAFVPAYQMVIISPVVASMRSCILESTLKSSLFITLAWFLLLPRHWHATPRGADLCACVLVTPATSLVLRG